MIPSLHFWSHLTDLGDSSFLMPAALLLAIYLYRGDAGARAAAHWLSVFGACGLGVLMSKVAYEGWELGIPAIDFRGFSGHSALAAALFPVTGFVAIGHGQRARFGAMAGLVLAVLVGLSRVVVGAHSVSEAASGLALGLLASAWYLQAPLSAEPAPRAAARGTRLILAMGATSIAAAWIGRAPTLAWTVRVAEELHRFTW